MKEKLINRVGRIVSGSFNSLVTALENVAPETVMNEAIREIDGAIDDVRVELGKVIAGKHLANSRLMEENKRHEELVEQIELAITEGRDDLAEAAIARQMDIEAQIPVLETTISEQSAQEKELEGYINALQAKKRQMRDELQQFKASQKEAETMAQTTPGGAGSPSGGVAGRVSKAESAFQRVYENTTGVLAAKSGSDMKSAVQLAELDDMARKNRIQERLAAIKGKVDSND
jgi:phage shock protein A